VPAPFQRYELLQRIGQGGMAEAWKARGITRDGAALPLVIKKILPELSRDPAFKQMFIDEAAIASQLEHPNIVRFLDFGRLDDQLYIALELVDGADVLHMSRAAREAGRKIGIPAAVAVASGVLAALEHAHTLTGPRGRPLKIVHRDVSAPNVLVSHAGEVKLSDFGIAVAAMRASHTATGMVRGNPRYMSP
jgi:serine/threonine-protein kinase